VAEAEPPPHVGGLRLAPYSGAWPDEVEPFAGEPVAAPFTEDAARAALDRILSHERVRRRLGGSRSVTIGVSRMGEAEKGEPPQLLVVAYDYTKNVAVEIRVDEASGELLDIADVRSQPALIQSELDRAIELARCDARMPRLELDGLVAMTIPIEPEELRAENHRLVEVLFGCRYERLPRYRAWVDLSTDQVLRAGHPGECCTLKEEPS
jgi:hypothetical protein